MTALNRAAREALSDAGITPAAWAARWFPDGTWGGDACGCPDDRCIGYHHDHPDDCGCLGALLLPVASVARARTAAGLALLDQDRCPHGRTIASRRAEPCPPGLSGCEPYEPRAAYDDDDEAGAALEVVGRVVVPPTQLVAVLPGLEDAPGGQPAEDARIYEHLVAFEQQTSPAFPQQFEGRLVGETWFYWRLRSGRAQLGLGATSDDAVAAIFGRGAGLGHAYEPCEAAELDRADYVASFLRLLRRIVY